MPVMKNNKRTRYYWLACIVLLSACKKWTDVKPVNEMTSSQVFSSESNVQEALNGVYLGMTGTAGYGKEATWGLVDVMGGIYEPTKLQPYEVEAVSGKFSHTKTQLATEDIWNMAYKCIANINNLVDGIDKADPGIFSGANRNLFKGEALAIRAFLHFDILRLFGPAPITANWNSAILPYVTIYSSKVTPRINGQAFLNNILQDITAAEKLLEADPVLGSISQDAFRARQVRFNYFAVKALQARVFLWAGDPAKALQSAELLINHAAVKYPWTGPSGIRNMSNFNYILSTENIFCLFIPDLRTQIEGQLINIPGNIYASTFPAHYGTTLAGYQQVYETSGAGVTDYRQLYMISTESLPMATTYLYSKLHQSGSGNLLPYDYAKQRIPLLRISEMFYIGAESLVDTDPEKAIGYLNSVRTARGISAALPANLDREQIRSEIRKEYMKEFPCEGQLFYFRKRTGEINHVLPLPQRELEYGS